MRVVNSLATIAEYPELVNIAERLAQLRAQVDATYTQACANVDAQHGAIEAEIAALVACIRRLQIGLSDRVDSPRPLPT